MARKIGRYEIYEQIGSGPFSEVYRAHDPEVNRPVAVKVLTALSDADNLARFRREAVEAGNLHHPNIVTIHDSGDNEGVPFIVMELVEGRDLQKEMAARKLSLLEKVEIMYQVAEGLDYAHHNKVVHRDLKPENIMVLPDGSVKLLDFGIARFDQPHAERQTQAEYLVGTILYMSPEQFQDGAVDSLCDIWAYGVVYYELLTGRHPFEAKDNAALMYKVTRTNPPRIGSLVNDIPEPLEQIVDRALARDRELRYQSLDDVQLDTLPVLMELRRQHASGVFAEARSLFDAGQMNEAMAIVRRVLDLDPGKVEARQLRDQIAKRMERFKVRPRVDALLKSAEQEIAGRRFGEAIGSLESALRLDQADASIRGKLEEARRLSEMSARSGELIAQAERDFRLMEFGIALRLTAEALRLDPGYPQAQRLMDAIQQEMARRERKRRLEEALEKARGLLLIQAFDEAFSVLDSLAAEFPADPQVAQLVAIAKSRQAERGKRNRLSEEMQAAKQLLKERRFADAVDRLRGLRGDFAGDPQFAELLTFAEGELRRQTVDQEVAGLVEQTTGMLSQNRFDEALKLIDRGLQKYASEGSLIKQFQTAMAAKTAFEKAKVIAATLERGGRLRQKGRPGDALHLIEAAVNRYGPEPALLRFQGELEAELKGPERAEALQQTLRQGEELLRQRSLEPAATLLQQAVSRYPESAELESLLTRVTEAGRQAEQRRFIEEQLVRALQLENAEQWDAARAVVGDALQHYPGTVELTVAQARLEKKGQEAQARKDTATYKLQVGQAAAARDWEQAEGLLEEARARIQAADFAEMRLQVLVGEVQDALARGDLQRTRDLIETGLNQYGEQERLLRLRQDLERETTYRESLAAAQTALAEKRFGPANDFLQKALESKPADKDALALLDSITAGREAAERAEAVAGGKQKLARLLEEKQFDSAVECVESLLALAPDDPELRARLAEQETRLRAEREVIAKRERQRAKREAQLRAEQDILSTKAEIESLLMADDVDNASRVFELSKLKHGNDARLREAERKLTAAAEKQRRDEVQRVCGNARDLLTQGRFDEALQMLESATVHFPDVDDFPKLLAEAEAARCEAEKQPAIQQTRDADAARLREIGEITEVIERHLSEGKWAMASSLAEAAQLHFPDTPEFAALKTRAQAGQRQEEIDEAAKRVTAVEAARSEARIAQAKQLLEAGKYAEAEKVLREALARHEKLAGAEELLREIERRKTAGVNQQRRIGLIAGIAAVVLVMLGGGLWKVRPNPARPPAILETWEHPTATRGEPYAGTVHATGGSTPLSWSVSKGALPGGLSLNATTGLIEGIPMVDGRYTFSARVADSDGRTAQREFAITVNGPIVRPVETRLLISNPSTEFTAVRGRDFGQVLVASDATSPVSWSLSKGSLPQGVILEANTGRIHGSPSVEGAFTFTARVVDGEGHSDEREFTITVEGSGPVVLNTGVPATAVRGEHYQAALRATGGTKPITWSYSSITFPRGFTLNPATGHLEGTFPAEGLFGFVAKATDRAGKSGDHAFMITVKAPREQSPGCVTKSYDYKTYGDLANGTLTWSGKLANGGELTINGHSPSSGSFRSGSFYLPGDGAHVAVDVTPATVKVKDAPSARNCWAPHLVLHNQGSTVSRITINWRILP